MMSEAPQEEAQVKESKVFNFAEEGEEPDLRDAWGRSTDEDEDVVFDDSAYMGMTVKQLTAEIKEREAAGRTFDRSSIKTKRDAVAALVADDRSQAEETQEPESEE